MQKPSKRSLTLGRETIRHLAKASLEVVAGGDGVPVTDSIIEECNSINCPTDLCISILPCTEA